MHFNCIKEKEEMGKGTCKSISHFHSLNLANTSMPKSFLKVFIPVINPHSINNTHGALQNFVKKTNTSTLHAESFRMTLMVL